MLVASAGAAGRLRGAFARQRGATPVGESVQTIWERRLQDECRQLEGAGQRFVLLLIAIDGEAAEPGTETLDLIGDSLRAAVRQSDVVVRAGAALYAVLLIGAAPEWSHSVGERLVNHLRADAGSLVRGLAERPLHFGLGVFDGSGSVDETIADALRGLPAQDTPRAARAA